MADRKTRAGRISKVHKPAMMRSEVARLGARFRLRFRIRSWCRIKTDSATMERSPPGRPSRVIMTMACRKSVRMSRILMIVSNCRNASIQAACGIRHQQVQIGGIAAHRTKCSSKTVSVYGPYGNTEKTGPFFSPVCVPTWSYERETIDHSPEPQLPMIVCFAGARQHFANS
jgi:hypothetical protein